jgi:hypothetical protein
MDSTNTRPLFLGIVLGLIIGVLLGMVLFWGMWPVQWTDAHSYDLKASAKAEYIALVADSYKLNQDPDAAALALYGWTDGEKEEAAAGAIAVYTSTGQPDKVQTVVDLANGLGIALPPEVANLPAAGGTPVAVGEGTAAGPEASAQAPEPEPTMPPMPESPLQRLRGRIVGACVACLVVWLVVWLLLLALAALLKRRGRSKPQRPSAPPEPGPEGFAEERGLVEPAEEPSAAEDAVLAAAP